MGPFQLANSNRTPFSLKVCTRRSSIRMAVTSMSLMDEPSIITTRVEGSKECNTRDSKKSLLLKFKDASKRRMRMPETAVHVTQTLDTLDSEETVQELKYAGETLE